MFHLRQDRISRSVDLDECFLERGTSGGVAIETVRVS